MGMSMSDYFPHHSAGGRRRRSRSRTNPASVIATAEGNLGSGASTTTMETFILRGVFQRQVLGKVSERLLVPKPRRRQAEMRGLVEGLQ
jgi:hypothetical protein